MATPIEELRRLRDDLERIVFSAEPLSDQERDAADAMLDTVNRAILDQAIATFERATATFLELSERLQRSTLALGGAASPRLAALQRELWRAHADAHDVEGMRAALSPGEAFADGVADETEVPPASVSIDLPSPPRGFSALVEPRPSSSRAFADLEDEYLRFFAGSAFRDAAAERDAKALAERALRSRDRYAAASAAVGAPWWFVAAIHMLESTFNFGTHLHNGDSLQARTHREPGGRPTSGSPPFTWEESARDALVRKFAGQTDWSLARCLHRWEAYNGFGYRPVGVPTPYLWSFTTIYRKGKFIRDHVFAADAVSRQCGAACLLRALMDLGEQAPRIEARDEGPGEAAETEAAIPALDTVAPAPSTNADFGAFFGSQLADVRHFSAGEFLVKGAAHARNGLNTDPPPELWPNVVPLARVLDHLRERLGHRIVLTSVYRSRQYNEAVGGAKASRHMAFDAADCVVRDGGRADDWAKVARQLRRDGVFSGGVGAYRTANFVHVDTRGVDRDLDQP